MSDNSKKVHIFFGSLETNTMLPIRKAIKTLIEADPKLSYTVIGNNRHDQYYFDENYTNKSSFIKNNQGNLVLVTDADIIIIPEIRCCVELALLAAAIRTGKTVYSETYGRTLNSVKDKIDYWNNEYMQSLEILERIEYEIDRYMSEIPNVDIRPTSENLPAFVGLENIDKTITFHECTKEEYAPKEVKEVLHLGLEQVNLYANDVNVVFGAHPEEFSSIFEKTLQNLMESGTYSSYALYSPSKNRAKLQQLPNVSKIYKKKPVILYSNEKEFISATTNAEVIIIPLINDHQAMSFLRLALTTGVPVFAGINACNTKNAKSLLHFLDMGSKITEPSINFEGWVADETKAYASCNVSDDGVATVSWLA